MAPDWVKDDEDEPDLNTQQSIKGSYGKPDKVFKAKADI